MRHAVAPGGDRGLFVLALVLAGCTGTTGPGGEWGGRPPAPTGGGRDVLVFPAAATPSLAGAVLDAPPELEASGVRRAPGWWRSGFVGVEFGAYDIREGDFKEWFDTGPYFGVRCSYHLGLKWAASLQAGYYRAETKVADGEDLTFFPLRATLELGSQPGPSSSRWFVGGGGGYYVAEALPSEEKVDLWPIELPPVASELTLHGVAGLEFRNKSVMATRLEVGHAWLLDSRADMWTMTLTLSSWF